MDRWKDVACPKCGQVKVHAWYFDSDCRGNPDSYGVESCKGCGHVLNETEKANSLAELWKRE